MKPTLLASLICALLLSCGCTPQIDTIKKDDLESRARATVNCTASSPDCYQQHILKGDACYTLMERARGSGDSQSQRQFATCAADELKSGLSMAPSEQTPVGPMQDYAVKRLEALRELIDTRRSGDPSGADELAAAAIDFQRQHPTDSAGGFYLASAHLTVAQDAFLQTQNAAQLCASLKPIDALAVTGGAAPGGLAQQYNNLAAAVAAMKVQGQCQ